jgi:hypothetical protein
MKRLLISIWAVALVASCPFSTSVSGPSPDPKVSGRAASPEPGTGNFVQSVIRELRSSGMEVSVGYPALYTPADCAYSYPVFHSCFGNNPASPYVMPVVKSWPDEYVDPAMVNGFGRTRPGYSATYRLDPREAVIVFGRMPPRARYLGLQTWLYTTGWLTSTSPWDPAAYATFASAAGPLIQYLFATVPGNPDRVVSFSSVDTNINDVVMTRQSGAPWDQFRYLVITPDKVTDEVVRGVLGTLGVEQDAVFTEGIPATFASAPVGPLGLGPDSVDFLTLVRYAMPDDEHAAEVWRKSLPLTVLRVRRPSSSPAPEPYGNRTAEPRTAYDEVGDVALNSDFNTLTNSVISRAESQGLTLESNAPMIDLLNTLGQFGPDCREIGMNCLGDNQDASYFLVKPIPLDGGQIYAVVSTLATETGNATYVGVSVNDASILKGLLNLSDTELKGSASAYGAYGKFFVHFFTRDCEAIANLTDGACSTITPDMVPLAGDESAPGDPTLHGYFSVAVRAYVVPGSERGPEVTKQLRPRVLTFSLD